MKFDWTQRVTLGLAVGFFAYFIAYTLYLSNKNQIGSSADANLSEEKSSQSAPTIGEPKSISQDDQKDSGTAIVNTNTPAPTATQSIPATTSPALPQLAAGVNSAPSEKSQRRAAASIYIRQARRLYEQHLYPAALAKCNQALKLEPGNREALDLRELINRFSDVMNQ